MRFHYLKNEAGGDSRIESVAIPLEDTHAYRCGEPMRTRHHAKRAQDFRAGRKVLTHRLPANTPTLQRKRSN